MSDGTVSKVEVSEPVAAGADAVWALLRDFGGIAKIMGGIDTCSLEGEGVGAVRKLTMSGGGLIEERLEAIDDAARTLSYSILGDSPLPVSGYFSTVCVVEEAPGRARIDWKGRFEPAGAPEETAQGIVRGIYAAGISGIRKTLGVT